MGRQRRRCRGIGCLQMRLHQQVVVVFNQRRLETGGDVNVARWRKVDRTAIGPSTRKIAPHLNTKSAQLLTFHRENGNKVETTNQASSDKFGFREVSVESIQTRVYEIHTENQKQAQKLFAGQNPRGVRIGPPAPPYIVPPLLMQSARDW